MRVFSGAERMMAMDDVAWARHANPLSVYTRMPILILFALAVWSRVWIGWWAVIPVVAVMGWTWLNPRVFPRPRSVDSWASKVVLGEQVYLDRRNNPVRTGHARAGILLSILSAAGLPFMAWGLLVLDPWLAAFGVAVSVLAKLWFCDRMVWLYDESAAAGRNA